ncbi:chromosome segregation protein SMC [Dialister sp.]|uniref:chromosome segregation protein SMC n=1 Tax=Dialister sp. TaxID=1955814 RepID=UPI002E80322F|nr:chromosome segregation protein SMC [Dialister sp.]MEE3452639.1 chromosome segregation protein SMC [Dialister sp.]
MKLLRLVLQGFKSFADKTTVEFADGMTVIVGPNGCGKSNISDAVRWVLGEQNVRNLRGQKAEDIIFSGSKGRAPRNGAEVTLVLDNSSHELPLDTAEVSITRRLLRNGDSDFRINKRSCRLKDIQELLAPTGLGKGSLAIIGQNRVDQVLTSRPEERRVIFEDVAGITLYRMRKNEGLRKLEKTAENMERVRDMMALLDEQLIPLKEGAEKSRVYKGIMKEKEAVAASMSVLKLTSIGRMLSRYENEYRNLEDEEVEWETTLTSLSARREKLEKQALDYQENLRNMGVETAGAQARMEELKGDFRVKQEALRHEEEKKENLVRNEEDQRQAEEELTEEIREVRKEFAEAETGFKEWKEKKEKADREKEELEKALSLAEAAYEEKLSLNRQKISDKQRLEQELLHLEEDIKREKAEKEELLSRTEEKKESLRTLEEELSRLTEEEKEKQQSLGELEAQGKKDSLALKEAQNRRFAMNNELADQKSEIDRLHSRREYLERADREYTNFSSTTKTIMDNADLFGESIHGILGELIRVPSEYTDAAEVALGNRISCIVTDTTKAAGEIIRWLKDRHLGRATFFPLESMHPSGRTGTLLQASKEKGISGIASDLLSTAPLYRDLLESLLGKTLFAENLEAARRVAGKYNYKIRIVTLDGQVVNAGGSMAGGSMRKKENTFFGRKQEINTLYKEEETKKKALDAFREKTAEADRMADDLAQKVMEERENWQKAKESLVSLTTRKEGLLSNLADRRKEAEEEEGKLGDKEKALQLSEEKKSTVSGELEKLKDIPVLSEDEESRKLRKALDDKTAEILAIHVSFTKAEEALNFGKRRLADHESAKEAQKKDREELEKAKQQNEEALTHLQEELSRLSRAYEEAEKAWKVHQDSQTKMQDESDAFANTRKTLDEEWRKAQEKSSALKRDMAEKQGRIDHFREQEKEEFQSLEERHMTLADAEKIRIPGSMADMKEKEEELSERLSALGSVNPNGEEDYNKELERRKFYEVQIEDLKKAREGLETVIQDIDETMTSQFKEAFKKVNEEFGRIMQLMFQGGKARLELTDEAHPLEGGVEMYLQLPGKKRQPLTLMSGGERALTVIALLISFMAYRPAPFCFVDEIDAALDDANVERYSRMIADYKKKTQFIVISHRKKTMEFADTLQGVTMAEKGVSSLITVKMADTGM